jgi:hypothetical protein
MKIGKLDFKIIKKLLNEKSIVRAKNFTEKPIIKKLSLNGSIELERKTAQRYNITLLKEENIFTFFRSMGYHILTIDDIDKYIEEVIESNPSRDTIQQWTESTKYISSPSLKGLHFSPLDNLDIKINNELVSLVSVNGLGYFFFYTEDIKITKETIVVGVENYQVIWFAKKYKEFFPSDSILFVVRNQFMREWIETLENEYIHFGDYDLAGINIYINDIAPRLKKCKKYSMFIPPDIDFLIEEYGDRGLFEKQKRYQSIDVKDRDVFALKEIILKHKKGLEQEGLYLFSKVKGAIR